MSFQLDGLSRRRRSAKSPVTNPIPRCTGAIHVYGGDFFNPNRKDVTRLVRLFEEENERWKAGQ